MLMSSDLDLYASVDLVNIFWMSRNRYMLIRFTVVCSPFKMMCLRQMVWALGQTKNLNKLWSMGGAFK